MFTDSIDNYFTDLLVHNIVIMRCLEGDHVVVQLVEALRYNPKIAGSIPDGVIGIFH